jgi:hypothetical protein
MKNQKGMTLIGMLMTVALLVMVGITIMRIVPVYMENYSIVNSIKSLNSTPIASLSGDPLADIAVLKRSLNKRLDINGIEDLKDNQILMSPDGEHKFKAHLKYQVIRSLVYNMSLLFDFDETYEVVAGSEN